MIAEMFPKTIANAFDRPRDASLIEALVGAAMLANVTKPDLDLEAKPSGRKYLPDDKLAARRNMFVSALRGLGKATSKELAAATKSDAMATHNDLISLCNDGIVDREKSRLELGHMRFVYWVADFKGDKT
jgi:hypothetical protein